MTSSENQPYYWVNYNDLTATSLGIMVSKGNHPQMALFQVSELLSFAQILGHGSLVMSPCFTSPNHWIPLDRY